jgi:hypothetical protein
MDAQEIKQLKELQDAYLSVYEAKKVDQDEDGDVDQNRDGLNNFADVMIARMIASGVSKEEAIRRVKDKEYNEEFEIDEATRMRRELGKEGEIATRQELAKRSNAHQRSGSVDKTIAAAERGAKNPYIKHIRGESDVDRNTRRRVQSDTLTKLAANRRKSVRSGEGLRGYAADVSGDDKDLQSARGSARSAGTLTSKEKKKLGEQYNLVLSYLLDEGYADTQESALVIMTNMSEEWRQSIVEAWEPITPKRKAKIDRKKESVRQKEEIAQYQNRPLDVQKQYTRGKALEFGKKMGDIGMQR